MELHKNLKCTIHITVIPKSISKHNIIKFQAWADSHVNFPYHERAPLTHFYGVSIYKHLSHPLTQVILQLHRKYKC